MDRWFTGQRWDGAIGLYDYGARWYDAALGRFISPDPIVPEPGNPQDLNRYSYVRNNPLKLVDRTGYFSEEAVIDYLKRTYGENWEQRLAEWKANTIWWRTLQEARPGDVLIVADEENQHLYGRIVGLLAEKAEQDVLLGLEQIPIIPRAFEEVGTLGERQDIGLWLERELLGLARHSYQGLTLRYWDPVSQEWSAFYINLPLIYRPEFGQTIHPVGWGLLVGFAPLITGEAYGLGTEALTAGPVGVPATIVLWTGGTYVLLTWYNIAMTPAGP